MIAQRLETMSHSISSLTAKNFDELKNLIVTEQGCLIKIILNRPKSLNALDNVIVTELLQILPILEDYKVVWMEGVGEKAFCAGGDIKNQVKPGTTDQDRIKMSRDQYELYYKLSQLKVPCIMNWNGIVMGGGAGLSAFAKYRLATDKTVFAMPQAKIGYFTDGGATYFLPRLRNGLGLYIGMTSAFIRGQDVYKTGLANYYMPSAQIAKLRQDVENSFKSTKSSDISSAEVEDLIQKILKNYHKQPSSKQIYKQDQIFKAFTLGSIDQIMKFLAKQSQNNQFYAQTLKEIKERCPLSVHTVFQAITRGKKMGIKECFIQQFMLCQHFSRNFNFQQGVRTLLIDRNDKPKWSPPKIKDVSRIQVDKLFEFADGRSNFIF